jgi:hypothetical protein
LFGLSFAVVILRVGSMGVTIHYRGKLDDLARVEEFEDRVLDVVAALGGHATIWRSFGQEDPGRIVRGLLVQMCPGQDTLSLLISPEGELLNLFEIKDAEQGPLPEPPYCFVKTQFGSLQGHVAVVAILDALRSEFFGKLEVSDESGYYEHRDPRELARKLNFLGSAILALGESLESSSLSPEAAEDPEILAARIQRVAELVARKMQTGGTSEVRPDDLADDLRGEEATLEELVRLHSQVRREAELRQERLMRRIEEGRGKGLSTDDALMDALQEVEREEAETAEDEQPPFLQGIDREELSSYIESELQMWIAGEEDDDSDDDADSFAEEDWEAQESFEEGLTEEAARGRHPALKAAEALYIRLVGVGSKVPGGNGFYLTALNGVGELLGGLAQATGMEIQSRRSRAALIVQLKRALKGLAFCRGGVYGLRAADLIDEESHRQLQEQLRAILEQLHELLAQAWAE